MLLPLLMNVPGMLGNVTPPQPPIIVISGGSGNMGMSDGDLFNDQQRKRLKQQIEEDELILIMINAIQWQ